MICLRIFVVGEPKPYHIPLAAETFAEGQEEAQNLFVSFGNIVTWETKQGIHNIIKAQVVSFHIIKDQGVQS